MDTLFSQLFLLVWIAVFYGILHIFHRLVPSGFIIGQFLFVYIWTLLPHYDIEYMGFIYYKELPFFWIAASLIFLFQLIKKSISAP